MKRVILAGSAAVALATMIACSDNKNPSPAAPTPGAAVASVAVSNTPLTASTFQLNATARLSDGSTRDVTTSSAWDTSNPALATVSSTGMLTSVGTGEVEARATYQSVMGSLKILVTRPPAPGAFSLTGVVREVAPTTGLLGSVRVAITAGPDAGASVVTDASGQFSINALSAGVITIEATKDGYELWRVSNLDMDQSRQLEITLYPDPPKNAAGALATARCADGSWSWAATRADACTANGGFAYGVCPGPICDGRLQPGRKAP